MVAESIRATIGVTSLCLAFLPLAHGHFRAMVSCVKSAECDARDDN
jgi:hypothetical protein